MCPTRVGLQPGDNPRRPAAARRPAAVQQTAPGQKYTPIQVGAVCYNALAQSGFSVIATETDDSHTMIRLGIMGVLLLALAACAPAADESGAPRAVERYLQTLVAKDRDAFLTLFCADYEADALIEFDSFGAVEATLEGVTCAGASQDGDDALVKCAGSIQVTYRGEDNKALSLADVTYRVRQEDGEWRVCGVQ